MENIGNFLKACEAYGLTKMDLFQTVDLYEAKNMPQVSRPCISTLNLIMVIIIITININAAWKSHTCTNYVTFWKLHASLSVVHIWN